MSLGFLTESALLPSKAKAIKVDSKSLVDLRAVVFQKEQERQERKRKLLDAATSGRDDDIDDGDAHSSRMDASGARGFGRFAHLKATKKRSGSHALSRDEDRIGKASNRGVDKRRRQDDAARALEVPDDDDDKAWHDKSRTMLAKKAELYDALVSGRTHEADAASAAAVTECLVDFRAKQQQQQQPPSTGVSDSATVEITDEFGRTRVVTTDSAAYAEYIERQAAAERPATARPHITASSPLSHAAHDDSSATATNSSSSSGFVTSQWEKRLNAQEKTYLQQVHASVGHAKAALPLDAKTRKQRRLEMLRQQQQQSSSSAVPAAASEALAPQVEQVATAQATAFLQDLL